MSLSQRVQILIEVIVEKHIPSAVWNSSVFNKTGFVAVTEEIVSHLSCQSVSVMYRVSFLILSWKLLKFFVLPSIPLPVCKPKNIFLLPKYSTNTVAEYLCVCCPKLLNEEDNSMTSGTDFKSEGCLNWGVTTWYSVLQTNKKHLCN